MEVKKLFQKKKSKLGFCLVVLRIPKTSPAKPKLNVVKMQKLTDIEKTESRKTVSYLKRTRYIGR